MKLTLLDFYTLHGRIGRLKFISGVTVVLVFVVLLSLAGIYFGLIDLDSDVGRIFALLLTLFFIVAVSPFFVKRLHDPNSHGGWAATLFVCLVFFRSNIWAAIFVCVGFLILLLKRGNPDKNEWGQPDT